MRERAPNASTSCGGCGKTWEEVAAHPSSFVHNFCSAFIALQFCPVIVCIITNPLYAQELCLCMGISAVAFSPCACSPAPPQPSDKFHTCVTCSPVNP